MIDFLKRFSKKYLPQSIVNQLKIYYNNAAYETWKKQGYPVPPPHIVKQKAIAAYQEKSGLSVLVETGTFRGDMVEAQKRRFKKVISIELSKSLYEDAKRRFRKDGNVEIVQGDSGDVLPGIVKNLREPAIFWLDGHYSAGPTAKGNKDCPIFEELDAIFKNSSANHILLIDDARCFTGEGDYPTIPTLTEYIKSKNPKYELELENDLMRYTVKN